VNSSGSSSGSGTGGEDASTPPATPDASEDSAETPDAAGSSSDAEGSGPPPPPSSVNVTQNRYDLGRTGENPNETILNTSNVSNAKFGLKFSVSIMGRVYGHPLYVSGLTINGATHNVMYVATEHNMVYAFDADSGGMPLWSATLEAPWLPGQNGFTPNCGDMTGMEVGITGTPVISLDLKRIYAVSKTLGKYTFHALDITTGKDVQGSPVDIAATGWDPAHELNRPGLLLVNNTVFAAFGSHCDDAPWHGLVLSFDAQTLAAKATFNTSPGGSGGAIWMSGTAPSSDGTALWVTVGNGSAYANNAVKLSTTDLSVLAKHQEPVAGDNDLVTGAILVDNQVLIGGKSGQVTLINAADGTLASTVKAGNETHNIATYKSAAGRLVYTCDTGATPHAWLISGGKLVDKGFNMAITTAHPGGMITTSSNNGMMGTGIAWMLAPTGGNAWHGTSPGVLVAMDAEDITKPILYRSDMSPGDAITTWAKFSAPIVANGKVYAATFDNKVQVYGLK
jgi:outer membrane protein assembly factor BamB